ncbi:MAG: ribonuclease III [Rikenellaceae bacterium]
MIDSLLFVFRASFSKDKQYYKMVKNIFGICPNNIELYKLALVHKSASVILEDGTHINNERLEFLGDAVIESIVSDMLYIDFPYESEGYLTQLRSRIVSRNSLNDLSHKIGLDKYIISQNSYGAVARRNIYGDAFEAIIGALYLDKGFDCCNRLLINRIFANFVDIQALIDTETDNKSRLIEWAQKKRAKLTIFTDLETSKDDPKNQYFVAVAKIDGVEYGYGIGNSKKEAEQRACKNAASKLNLKF